MNEQTLIFFPSTNIKRFFRHSRLKRNGEKADPIHRFTLDLLAFLSVPQLLCSAGHLLSGLLVFLVHFLNDQKTNQKNRRGSGRYCSIWRLFYRIAMTGRPHFNYDFSPNSPDPGKSYLLFVACHLQTDLVYSSNITVRHSIDGYRLTNNQ